MPIALILLILNVTLIVHAAKTGRFSPWGYIIILMPGIGGLVYILVELVPEWFGSPGGQKARKRVAGALNPEKNYRMLTDQLAIADTIATRVSLAEECLALGKFDEAYLHFDEVLKRPHGDDPNYFLGRARAEFGMGKPDRAVATLDELRDNWPNFQSAEGHLLYARSLEEAGRLDEALEEYRAVSDYFPGQEARVRWALLLQKQGQKAEARAIFESVLTHMRRAPKYIRKVQAEWIEIAQRASRV
jgi:hypothetical protein